MKKILIVEDEVKLRKELKICLENNGYQVLELEQYQNAINDIITMNADLILLDINLPNINGEYICKELRKVINTPIVMVTCKNNELDELLSINYGADDYITKPYNVQILLARINRLLNRKNSDILKYKELILDLSKSWIMKNDNHFELSKNEFRILYFLLLNRGQIISRDALMDYLWDNNDFVDDNTLTVNINRLRKRLDSLGYSNVILTKRSQGYIIL